MKLNANLVKKKCNFNYKKEGNNNNNKQRIIKIIMLPDKILTSGRKKKPQSYHF